MLSTIAGSTDSSGHINFRRLILLRGIGIAGVLLAMLITEQGLGLRLPSVPLIGILLLLISWNFATWWRICQPRPIRETEVFLQLAIDLLAVAALLYFTGGATNPFAWVLLLPVIIAATVLPRHLAWASAALAIAAYSLLMRFYVPLGEHGHDMAEHAMTNSGSFSQHIFGMWFGFIFSVVMVAYFVAGMANTLRERDSILAQAREQALRDERLVALGTLAAGAAHELGTPLGTMAIVIDELKLDYPADKDADLYEHLQILREQIDRCKEALSVISASAGKQRADGGQSLPADIYLHQLSEQWQVERPGVSFSQQLKGPQPAPSILADQALNQALTNILNNAADVSPDSVELQANWYTQTLDIQILDRGPGLSEAAASAAGKTQFSSKDQGLGVGLFLAHAVIERLGGHVSHLPRNTGGNCTCIRLPLIRVNT